LQALRFPSLRSDHGLGVRKGGKSLVAFGGQQETLKITSETVTLGASVKEIIEPRAAYSSKGPGAGSTGTRLVMAASPPYMPPLEHSAFPTSTKYR